MSTPSYTKSIVKQVMTTQQIQELIQKYFKGETTEEEENKIHLWYSTELEEALEANFSEEELNHSKAKIYNQTVEQLGWKNESVKVKKSHLLYYIAASILLTLTIGLYFYSIKSVDQKTHYTKLLKGDIGPGGSNATLQLANGKIIQLNPSVKGAVYNNEGIKIEQLANGKLVFKILENHQIDQKQNVIQTPPGGQYQIILPDGSEVYLNASTTFKFPTKFDTEVRKVEIKGEAYFNILKANKAGKSIPFIVESDLQKIEVLGTQFNVNNYADEEEIKTTLIEGAVRVSSTGLISSKILAPGEQATLNQNGFTVNKVDINTAIAWKNGDFIFDNEDLHSIMRKISRWYDVEVLYDNYTDNIHFSGAVSKYKNLSEAIKIMELTNKVKFKIEGRRIRVLSI